MKYDTRKPLMFSVIHWGQRKLLMSEIEFFNIIGKENLQNAVVIYAGAAAGYHIRYLKFLFPRLQFVLIDPAEFIPGLADQRTEVIQGLFTDEMALDFKKRFEGQNTYFISDIRENYDRDNSTEGLIANDELIMRNMRQQESWVRILRPRRSMLKFRLPWNRKGLTKYIKGDIYLPVWGPVTTTECRLITEEKDYSDRIYDDTEYEEKCFYFNRIMRPSVYLHPYKAPRLDHCYDCTAEVHILNQYLNMFGNPYNDYRLHLNKNDLIANMMHDIKFMCRSEHSNKDL
jgi:cap2 methyltransferase